MSAVESKEERRIFIVKAARLAFGKYEGEKKTGEGDIYASYSADRIADGRPIRKPFEFQGSFWVCVCIAGSGATISKERELHAYRLVPERLFSGQTETYATRTASEERVNAVREDPLGFYHGLIVKHGANSFVLAGPPAIFMTDGDEPGADDESGLGDQLSLF